MPAPSSPQLRCIFRRSRNEIIPVQAMRQAAKAIQGSSAKPDNRGGVMRGAARQRDEKLLRVARAPCSSRFPRDTPGVSLPGDWVATLCHIFAGLPLYRYR
jgi:hypothetical protein